MTGECSPLATWTKELSCWSDTHHIHAEHMFSCHLPAVYCLTLIRDCVTLWEHGDAPCCLFGTVLQSAEAERGNPSCHMASALGNSVVCDNVSYSCNYRSVRLNEKPSFHLLSTSVHGVMPMNLGTGMAPTLKVLPAFGTTGDNDRHPSFSYIHSYIQNW